MSNDEQSAIAGPSTLKRSLNRQFVLEEDEYTEALEHIIARDFFPSLVHLDATNEYLSALESEDPSRIGASVLRLEQISNTPRNAQQTPFGMTPRDFVGDTPLRTPRGEPLPKRPKYDTSLSLDNFQAKYTSEDNSSFTEIVDDENKRRKEIYGWAYEAERKAKEKQLKIEQGRERMLIEAGGSENTQAGIRQKLAIEQPTPPKGLITMGENDEHKDDEHKEQALILTEKSDEPEDVMAPKKDTRVTTVDGWKFTARNSLMFGPDANESPYHTFRKPAEPDPKSVTYSSTRLPEQDESGSDAGTSVPPSPTRSRIDAAIANTAYHPSGASDPFSLVPNLPSPTPAELGPKAVKQLMTMGTLSATPRVISKGGDDPMPSPGTPFHISKPSSREAISHRLANDARKSLRTKANLLSGVRPRATPKTGGSMPPPTWTPRKTPASLTPAARNLLDRTALRGAASQRARAMDKASGWTSEGKKEQDLTKVRWTPTPGRS